MGKSHNHDHDHKRLTQRNTHRGRRQFLKSLGCTAMGATAFLSGLTNLNLLNAAAANNLPFAAAPNASYRAIVCLFLEGGNDSFNMVVPRGTSEYAQYAQVRSNQALAQGSLLPINPNTSDGKDYGLHPNLTNIQSMFESGKAAVVANVGSLVAPTSMTDYNNELNLPLGLFSHIDQATHWQTSIPQSRTDIGWGGRLADIIKSQNSNADISMNISLDGTNIYQNGDSITEYAIRSDGNGSISINGYDQNDYFNTLKRQTVDNLLDNSYQSILRTAYTQSITNSQSNALQFGSAIASVTPFTTVFPDTDLGQKLHMTAKTIAANGTLGMARQSFFISMGGYDNHDEVIVNHGNLMAELDAAVGAFYAALDEINLSDCVCSFTMSDFARTLTSNGNGTDHGWGGNCIVMGGGVNGQEMYGQYPELYLDNPLDTGDGRLIPTLSCDEYFAELALWFADNGSSTLSATQLTDIFPNLTNFWSPSPGQKPIGFMA